MPKKLEAFTLIELLVIISIISLLMVILIPALRASKNQAKMIVCKNNLRQLALTVQNYANDYHGYSVPGAMDLDSNNLHRWHGKRSSTNDPFDPAKGPLGGYLQDSSIPCPQAVPYTDLSPSDGAYENGNGGYGYNLTYVGSRIWESGYTTPNCAESTRLTEIRHPQDTLLFADTAMVKRVDTEPALIRYAFAEPRFFVINQQPDPILQPPAPSLHFRHRKNVCIVWADSHTSHEKTAGYKGMNNDGTSPAKYNVGWFEPMDNSLFDLK